MEPRGIIAVAALAVALSLTTAIGASAVAYSWYRAASRSDMELQTLRYEMTQRRLQQVARHHQCAPCPACEYHSPAPGAVNAVEVTDDNLFVRTNVLHLDGQRHMQLPPNATYIVEIGASDRNTLDQELLPRRNDLFLITLEPVIDKYARALARHTKGAGDGYQKLGRHHQRGVVLPIAIGGSGMAGVQKLHVSRRNAGCSSLLPIDNSSNRKAWCALAGDTREVPTVTLDTLLGWIGQPVEFLKVDAQGLDLAIVRSAPARLASQVRSFAMEVILDDCHGLYEGQPKCSTVLQETAALGFKPASNFSCVPRWRRKLGQKRTSAGCELDVLFVRPERDPRTIPDLFWEYHTLHLAGCSGLFPFSQLKQLARSPPPGFAIYHFGGAGTRFFGTGKGVKIDKHYGVKYSLHAYGMPYLCARETVTTESENEERQNRSAAKL